MKNSGLKNIDFKYNLVSKSNNKRTRQRNIIRFNPSFSQKVSTNVAKRFLDLLDKYFPQNNQLHKIFNKNTVKISYSCTPNVGSIIKSLNKKLTNGENKQTKNCNCGKKEECPLEGNCRSEYIICKCVVTRKFYLCSAECNFNQRYCNQKKSFRNQKYGNETPLSKYICKMKNKHNVSSNLIWCMVKSVPGYSNTLKSCMLCYMKNIKS